MPTPSRPPRPARRSGRRRLRRRGRVDLELVDAGLGAVVGRQDRQADHPGPHRREPLDVAPRVDHRPGRRVAIGLGQRLEVIEPPLDPGQLGGDRGRLAPSRLGIGRGDLALGVVDPGEDRPGGRNSRVWVIGSNLWSWHRAHWTVRPRNVVPVAVIMSSRSSARCWSIPSTVWLPTMSCVPADQEPGRRLGQPVAAVGGERVAGELLEDEPGERRVAVERADHVVAIGPGGRPRQVGLVALALAEPDDVEPVPAPALAVMGRGQQPVDQRLVGQRVGIGRRTRRPASGVGRQAGQVERDAADQRGAVGLGRRPEPGGFEPGEDERIDRRADPGRVGPAHRGRGDRPDRPERPPVGAGPCAGPAARSDTAHRPRPRPAPPRPAPSKAAPLGGISPVGDLLDQQALVGLARHDRRPALAAGQRRRPPAQVEPPLLLLRPVARHALLARIAPASRRCRCRSRCGPWRILCPVGRRLSRAKFARHSLSRQSPGSLSSNRSPGRLSLVS